MPFDWGHFGSNLETSGENILKNRFQQSNIGQLAGDYNGLFKNTGAPMIPFAAGAGGTSTIGQQGNNQPTQTDPQDAVLNHWKEQNRQTGQPDDSTDSDFARLPEKSDPMKKVEKVAAVAAMFA